MLNEKTLKKNILQPARIDYGAANDGRVAKAQGRTAA
jgi:hypothetical protein